MKILNFENYVIKYNPMNLSFREIRDIFYDEINKERQRRLLALIAIIASFCICLFGITFIQNDILYKALCVILFGSIICFFIHKPCIGKKDYSDIIKTCYFRSNTLIERLSENKIVGINEENGSYYFIFDGIEKDCNDRVWNGDFYKITYDIDVENGDLKTTIDLTGYNVRNIIVDKLKYYVPRDSCFNNFFETCFEE